MGITLDPKKRRQLTLTIPAIVILLVLAGITLYIPHGLKTGKLSFISQRTASGLTSSNNNYGEKEKWREGVINYNGKHYRYNHATNTYLVMGIDREGKVERGANYTSGGQSDTMFLVITDDLNKQVSVIPINRNTMTNIKMCDINGNNIGTFKAQICLQHGYGDGLRSSCQKSVNAVSELFYDIPITGYISMNMDVMMILNRLAGGVTVEVLETIIDDRLNVELIEGETIKLTDEQAYAYLRDRDSEAFGAANRRLEREQQYSMALYENLKEKIRGDKNLALDMYNQLQDYIVSNIEFANIVEDLISYGFGPENIYTIPGELTMGKKYEEFYVDNDALYAIILRTLYTEIL